LLCLDPSDLGFATRAGAVCGLSVRIRAGRGRKQNHAIAEANRIVASDFDLKVHGLVLAPSPPSRHSLGYDDIGGATT